MEIDIISSNRDNFQMFVQGACTSGVIAARGVRGRCH